MQTCEMRKGDSQLVSSTIPKDKERLLVTSPTDLRWASFSLIFVIQKHRPYDIEMYHINALYTLNLHNIV